jgi:pimeloyl-ACP methyl ester carboxylesterase
MKVVIGERIGSMATIAINGVRIAYDEVGTGPTVVWVHGSWTDRHGAGPFAQSLAERYRVITYDRRGHSGSERPPGHHGVVDHADDLIALIERLDPFPAHLVTNSFGGLVGLEMAARRPDLVGSLCLHEPPVGRVFADDPEIKLALEAVQRTVEVVIADLERGNDEAAARTFMETIAMGPGAWEALPDNSRRTFVHNAPTFRWDNYEETVAVIDTGELANVRAPVLLTEGGRTPAEFAVPAIHARLAAALPLARRHTFANAGHVPHRSHPDEFAEVIGEFLDEVDGRRTPSQ